MGRPNPFRETSFAGANEDRENIIFPCYPTMSTNGNHAWSIHTLLSVLTMHTYSHLSMAPPPVFCNNIDIKKGVLFPRRR